jgi:hypothetical protein
LIEIKGKIARKSKFWGSLRAKLKKFTTNDHFVNDIELWQPNWLKSGMKLKRTESLMLNWRLNWRNSQQVPFCKRHQTLETQSAEIRDEIEEI